MAVPSTHEVAILVRHDGGGYHFETKRVPVPEVGPSDLLVRLSVSGVCGSDFHLAEGHSGPTRDILGHEGVGSLGVQYARAMGYRVIAIDVGDSKRDYCLSLGAEAYLDAKTHNIEEAVASLTTPASGGGAAAVLVMANSGRAYEAALELVAPYGTLVCVGIPPPDQQVRFHPHLGIGKNVRIVGSAVGTRKDIWDAVEFVKRGVVTPVVEMAKLDDLSDIARNFGKIPGKYVLRLDEESA